MKLAIMQPYLFPNLGYFQLMGAVDKFVVYDDVAFIKRGWINRNYVLGHEQKAKQLFSVPLRDASQFRPINQTEVDRQGYAVWLRKFFKTVDQIYMRAPGYTAVRQILESVFAGFEGSIGELARRSLTDTAQHLGIRTSIVGSSAVYGNSALTGKTRVIDICLTERATEYINLSGGVGLYTAEDFSARGIELHFIRSRSMTYQQFANDFVPGLSIIDVMMFNPPTRIREVLTEFDWF
jgi:hypothetical protein